MNKKEAIDRIKQTPLYRYESSGKYVDGKECSDLFNALDCGIKALEELNLYEENGLCLIPSDIYERQCKELDRLKGKERLRRNTSVDDNELTQPLGFKNSNYLIPDGAIFVHDRDDNVRGSIAEGCLKLCWTPDGNCYGCLCGDTVVFHAEFKNTDLFRKVDTHKINKLEKLICNLEKQLSEAKDELKQIKGT